MLPAVKSRIEQHDGIEQGEEADKANKKYDTAAMQPLWFRARRAALQGFPHPFNQACRALDAGDARQKIDQCHE